MPRPGAPPQRRTVLQGSTPPAPAPHPEQGARPRQAVDTRPMVAVLAAPGYGAGGEVFALRAGKNVLGAAPGSDVVLGEDSEVSGEHALILYRDGKLYLSDRMSTNGTRVNGETLDPTQNAILVKDKDWIRCGRTDLVLLVFDRPAARDAGEPS